MALSDSLNDLEILFLLSGILYLFYFLISPTQSLADVITVLYTFTFIIFVLLALALVSIFNLFNLMISFINSVFNLQLITIQTSCLRTQIVPTVDNILFAIFSIFPSNLLPIVYPKGITTVPSCSI